MSRATGDPPLVEIVDLSVRRHRETLLDRVSLTVAESEVHVIVGPNGAGKTTLLSALLGHVAFDGQIVAHWRRAGTIGYVPQHLTVDPTLPVTVVDFLALTRQRRPICLGIAATASRQIAALLDRAGLTALARRPLSVLSGGELRRVLLAHALDPIPELLVLDEPASGLDDAAAAQLEAMLETVTRERRSTVLMVSHDLEQVRRLADHVTLLDRSVCAQGPPDRVLNTERFLASLAVSRRDRPSCS